MILLYRLCDSFQALSELGDEILRHSAVGSLCVCGSAPFLSLPLPLRPSPLIFIFNSHLRRFISDLIVLSFLGLSHVYGRS